MSAVDAPLAVDRVTLDWLRLAATSRVSAEFAANLNADIRREPWGILFYQLVGQVLADKLPPETVTERKTFTFEVPASPWQQFKATHAQRWWLRRIVANRPVRMVQHVRDGELIVNLERFHIYPEARVQRQLGQPVQSFMLNHEVRWGDDQRVTS